MACIEDLTPMARNIEIKARIDSAATLEPKAAALATSGPIEIRQDDTFFRCQSGRLKLRAFSATEGELIFYRRADEQGPKESFYIRSATTNPEELRESLSLACGQAGRVVKQRTLYLAGRTRIHIDRVEGLGDFMELEVVLEDGEPAEAGTREAQALMTRLGIEPSRLVATAYVDLLAEAGVPRATGAGATGAGPAAASAVLVIDVQQGLCEGEGTPFDCAGTIARINRVTGKARAAAAPVIFIQHESSSGYLEYGSAAWQLARGLDVQASDIRIRKATADSFLRTGLEKRLRELGTREVIVCGMHSEFCVDTTVRRALALGFPVVLVADAHTSAGNAALSGQQVIAHHNALLADITSFGPRVRIVSSEDVAIRRDP